MTSKIAAPMTDRSTGHRACFVCLIVGLITSTLSGCVSVRGVFSRKRDYMAGAPQLKHAKNPRVEEVIAHLNDNTNQIQSWRTNSVSIRAENTPRLSGNIAVEKGRHLRLNVNSPMGGKVLDLGSNNEQFWVWSRWMNPEFVTCQHENIETARHELGIPFEPDWLMQVLGVEPLPTSGVTIEVDRSKEQARLIEETASTHGLPLRRAVLVDLKLGIVLEHTLYTHDARKIASARLSDHRIDKKTKLVLPHQIALEWPQNKMSMSLRLDDIQVNTSSISASLWDMPAPQDCQVVHLDAGVGRKSIQTAVRSPDRSGVIENVRTHNEPRDLRENDESEMEDEPTGRAVLTNEIEEIDSDDGSEDDWAK